MAAVLAAAGPVVMYFEGKRNQAYLDPVNVMTVCYGHTGNVRAGEVLSDEQCLGLLDQDMRQALLMVSECIDVELAVHEWAALTSWTYNVGSGAACRSTLAKQVNAGLGPQVWCQQLLRWIYAGGRQLPGLVRRREAEYRLCLGEQ